MKNRLIYVLVIFFGVSVLGSSAWAQVRVQKGTQFKAPPTVQKQQTKQPLPPPPDAQIYGAPLPPTLVWHAQRPLRQQRIQ